MQIPEIMSLAIDLAEALGVSHINRLPGCWEVDVGGGWWLAVNGHRDPVTCSRGASVPPFTAWIEFNGFPAGIIDLRGGTIAAGEAANEDTLAAAIKERIAAARKPASEANAPEDVA